MSEEKKKKILVVDDEKSTTLSIASHLKNFASQYDISRAFTKDEAMEAINKVKPELVLLDIELNGVNSGVAILDYLNHEHKDIKTIIISGKADHLKEHLKEMGCFYFFTKPADLQELNNKIKDALGIEKVFDDKVYIPRGEKPQAKLTFIAMDMRAFSYFASIFDPIAKELLNGAEYKINVVTDLGQVLDSCMNFQSDIVLIGDYYSDGNQLINIVKLVQGLKIRPKAVIVHGLFERDFHFESTLMKLGVVRCIQNVMKQDELLEMNRILADAVADVCVKQGLIR